MSNTIVTQEEPLRPFSLSESPGGDGCESSGSETAPEAASLGNNTVFASLIDSKRVFARENRYVLQRFVRSILPRTDRIGVCHRLRNRYLDLNIVMRDTHARYTGLCVCASVWKCPVCSARIAAQRARELETLLEWAQRQGLRAVFITFTARHTRETSLKDMVARMSRARRAFKSGRGHAVMMQGRGLVGRVSALECTWGEASGWHPHYHEIWFLRGSTFGIGPLVEQRWLSSVASSGLEAEQPWGCRVEEVAMGRGVAVAGYLAKFGTAAGASAELAGGMTTKKTRVGERYTPNELLGRAYDGCKRSKGLWLEYVSAFVGRAQLRWSRGLKELAGVDDVTDTDIAADGVTPVDILLGSLSDRALVLLCKYEARARCLELAETGGMPAVMGLIAELEDKSANELKQYLQTYL